MQRFRWKLQRKVLNDLNFHDWIFVQERADTLLGHMTCGENMVDRADGDIRFELSNNEVWCNNMSKRRAKHLSKAGNNSKSKRNASIKRFSQFRIGFPSLKFEAEKSFFNWCWWIFWMFCGKYLLNDNTLDSFDLIIKVQGCRLRCLLIRKPCRGRCIVIHQVLPSLKIRLKIEVFLIVAVCLKNRFFEKFLLDKHLWTQKIIELSKNNRKRMELWKNFTFFIAQNVYELIKLFDILFRQQIHFSNFVRPQIILCGFVTVF